MPTAAEFNRDIDLDDLNVAPDSIAIVPADGVKLTRRIRRLRANTAGTVACLTAGSGAVVRTLNFAAGETREIAIIQINATGTTATGLEGMP